MQKTIIVILTFLITSYLNAYSQGFDGKFNIPAIKGGAKRILIKSKPDRPLGNKDIWTICQYYNNRGQIIKQESRFQNELRSIYLFEYDINGYDSIYIEDFSVNHPNKKLLFRVSLSFNDKLQIIKYVSKEDLSSSQIVCTDFVYDTLNRLRSYTYYYINPKDTTTWRYRYIYDNNSKVQTKVTINSQNVISSIDNLEYDRWGNVKVRNSKYNYILNVQKKIDELDEALINDKDLEVIYINRGMTEKWRYSYDKKGNWTKKFIKNGLFYKLDEERTITY